jgi:hypothetical protein
MEVGRAVAALVTALTLMGGSAAVSGCGAQESGTGTPEQTDLPDNSDPDQGNEEDQNDDSQDPD